MIPYLAVLTIILSNAFILEAADVLTLHDVDPSKIDYKNATRVVLKNITIRDIPKNYFSDMGLDLSMLKIEHSQLRRIDEQAFDGLHHLNLLELSNDKIETIKPNTFTRLKGLELLLLKSNKIRRVSLALNNVQEIVLSYNAIDELQKGFLIGNSITFIDLKFNHLKRLVHSMKSLTKLAAIDISNNQITDIDEKVFVDNDNLVRVIASGNRLESTKGLRLNQLMTLDLSHNYLQYLDNSSFAGMSFLDDLQLRSNKISKMSSAFDDVKNLKFLDLSENLITEISPTLFQNNPYLSKLRLSNNWIKDLKPFTNQLRHLQTLDLSHNRLEHIDDKFFSKMLRLEILDLSFNKLTTVGSSLMPLADLITLDLSSNSLALNNDTLSGNKRLVHLNISSNGLDMKLSFLNSNSRLGHLDLSRNNITEFCDSNLEIITLNFIDLSGNQIKQLNCLKENNLIPFSQINIKHNPLTCGSDLDDVLEHFVLMRSLPLGYQHVTVKFIESEAESLSMILDQWNLIKREFCPNGLDIHIETVISGLESDYYEDVEKDDDYERYWYHDYYESSRTSGEHFWVHSDYAGNEDAGTANPNDSVSVEETSERDIIHENEISNSHSNNVAVEVSKPSEQSAKDSWEKIEHLTNLEIDYEDGEEHDPTKSQYSLFTISILFLGVSLILVLANVAVIVFIRMKGWKKDFRGLQKYTHLDNQVYRETTAPNDFTQYDTKKSANYGKNCSKIFSNFGFRVQADDTESDKRMIVCNSIKAEV